MNQYISFNLYVAAQVFIANFKRHDSSQDCQSNLRFLVAAMEAIKQVHPLTEIVLVQLKAEMAMNRISLTSSGLSGLSDPIEREQGFNQGRQSPASLSPPTLDGATGRSKETQLIGIDATADENWNWSGLVPLFPADETKSVDLGTPASGMTHSGNSPSVSMGFEELLFPLTPQPIAAIQQQGSPLDPGQHSNVTQQALSDSDTPLNTTSSINLRPFQPISDQIYTALDFDPLEYSHTPITNLPGWDADAGSFLEDKNYNELLPQDDAALESLLNVQEWS
jgi:hypothetical protein